VRVTMPQLGESVTEGTINRWLKAPGDRVEKYEALLEVTTDKVNAEVPAPVAGVVRRILRAEGETVPVGADLCELEGEEEAEAGDPGDRGPAGATPQRAPIRAEGFVRASPYVRRRAREAGVDLRRVPATGTDGRVTREDLERFLAGRRTPEVPSGDEWLPLTAMRRAVAEHMVRSKRTAPHATTWFEVDMSGVVALRERVRQAFEAEEGVPLTYLPFVVEATVGALRRFPILNSEWREDGILVHRALNIGIAVAVPDGLVVPVLHGADRYSLRGLARGIHELVTRAREGRLTPADVAGGTFTVNNPGAFGSIQSTPILNAPQAAILSMEAIVRRVVVVGDALAVRSMMTLSLSFDHRVLDGAIACQFLAAVKAALEEYGPEKEI
jgi:2-oxoisovalerate dehydrogenase E2 component (dihydrolipoyl transacylase)